MKKMMMMAVMMVMTLSASAISYETAREEALFLSDKMAYELNLTTEQYEAIYEINLDYLLSLGGRDDVMGAYWNQRDAELRFVLDSWQYDRYIGITYFYRPVAWLAGAWTFGVYAHYDRARFYYARPRVYISYRGGSHRFHPHNHPTWRHTHHPSVAVRPHHGGGHHGLTHHGVGHHGGGHFGGTHHHGGYSGGGHFGHSGSTHSGGHSGGTHGGGRSGGGHSSTHLGGGRFGR